MCINSAQFPYFPISNPVDGPSQVYSLWSEVAIDCSDTETLHAVKKIPIKSSPASFFPTTTEVRAWQTAA